MRSGYRWPLALFMIAWMVVSCSFITLADDSEMELNQFERDIGEQVYQQIVLQYGGVYYPDYQEQLMFDEIFARLQNAAQRRDVEYSLTLLQSPIVNAFAVPGGYIFLTRGLLQHMRMDPQALAAIIGHEIAHVEKRHGVTSLARQLGLTVLVELGLIFFDMQNSEAVRTAGAALVEMAQAGYSRSAELEADRLGLELAVRAGFDPMGAVYAMDHLAALPKDDLPLAWFRSHPDTASRQQQLLTAALEHWPTVALAPERAFPDPIHDPYQRYEFRQVADRTVVYDMQNERETDWFAELTTVTAVAMHPEGIYAAATGETSDGDAAILFCDRYGRSVQWRLWQEEERITALTWDSSGQRIAYGLSTPNGHEVRLGHLYGQTDVSVPSQEQLATLAWDQTGLLWETVTGQRFFWELGSLQTVTVSQPVPPIVSPYWPLQGEVTREGDGEDLILRIRRPSLELP